MKTNKTANTLNSPYRDKFGEEISKGDKVQMGGINGVVLWLEHGSCAVQLSVSADVLPPIEYWHASCCEVIERGVPESVYMPQPESFVSAPEFLEAGARHMRERAAQRDKGSERSMRSTVQAFNVLFGKDLTETEGWRFMELLKIARSRYKYNPDDYEDGCAYAALAGESAAKDAES